MWNFLTLASLCSWAYLFESYLVENPEDRFSGDEAHSILNKAILKLEVDWSTL